MRYLLVILMLSVSSAASAEVPARSPTTRNSAPPSAWELDLYGAYGRLAYPGVETASQISSRGGPAFAASVAYRGLHFTHPFLDVSYNPILWTKRSVNVFQPGGDVQTLSVNNAAYALGFIIGAGWDIDLIRARVGVGLYNQHITTHLEGRSDSSTQLGLGFLAGLSVLVWRLEPFALGLQGRLAALQAPFNGIYQVMWSAGITGRWDFSRSP